MAQFGFFQDANICIGCRTCVMACKDKNDLPVGEKFRKVYDYAGCSWETAANGSVKPVDFFSYSVSTACNHCANPVCITSCPTDAIVKREEDGIVVIVADLCIGCGACVTACPFAVPYMSKEQSVARKCDLCYDLIDKGEVPYCVAACSCRALEYGDIEELKAKHPNALTSIAPISDSTVTGPSALYEPNRLNPTGAIPGEILNAPEEIVSEAV